MQVLRRFRSVTFSALAALVVTLSLTVAAPPAQAMLGSTTNKDMTKSVALIKFDNKPACTGTVVSQSGWILTAHHCLSSGGQTAIGNPARLSVELWSAGVGVTGSEKFSGQVLAEPKFMANSENGQAPMSGDIANTYRDMALIYVGQLPSWVKPIPIATSWPKKGTKLTQFGYGRTSRITDAPMSTPLRKSAQGDIYRVTCPTVYKWSSGNVCTKASRSWALWGDSGGPLLWWTNGGWRLAGVFSLIWDTKTKSGRKGYVRGFWAPMESATATFIRDTIATNPVPPTPAPPTPVTDYGPAGTILIDPCLDFHQDAGHTSPVVGCIPKGTLVKVQCVAYSNYVTGPYGSTNIWDRVAWGGRVGFVTDAWVYTGKNGAVAGPC